MDLTPVGYKAICVQLQLNTIPHYRDSFIARQGQAKTIINNHHETHIYPKTYSLQNDDDLFLQLEFALKYDGINLPIIKALFEKSDQQFWVKHIQQQPTGIYSRKIWFLYEFLMNEQLELDDLQKIKYVDLVDAREYFTSTAIKSSRHAIKNNLLGNHTFCPFVRKTVAITSYIDEHLEEQAHTLLKKYDPYIIARASNYLYAKETLSSYQIEREQPSHYRLQRFVNVLQEAARLETLSKEKLIELQNIIVDPRFANSDYRDSQNYIGETVSPYFQKVHYISPKPEDMTELMQGLLESLERMLSSNVHPVIIAAVISFGFVFIHPFEDGNGRIHRFLIHYILSKQGFAPKDMIFPVSSIMLQNMREYDVILESFSKPLLTVLNAYHLSDEGIMTVEQDSKIYYQYLDYTLMTEYLFACIKKALLEHIEREIEFLIKYDKTRKAIQDIVDMPDNKINLLITLVLQNHGKLSAPKRHHHFALLSDAEVATLVELIGEMM